MAHVRALRGDAERPTNGGVLGPLRASSTRALGNERTRMGRKERREAAAEKARARARQMASSDLLLDVLLEVVHEPRPVPPHLCVPCTHKQRVVRTLSRACVWPDDEAGGAHRACKGWGARAQGAAEQRRVPEWGRGSGVPWEPPCGHVVAREERETRAERNDGTAHHLLARGDGAKRDLGEALLEARPVADPADHRFALQ